MRSGDGGAKKPGMGDGAADEGHVLHAREADVGDELPFAAQESVVLLAPDRGPDPLRNPTHPGASPAFYHCHCTLMS
jgi:hypothetical protein